MSPPRHRTRRTAAVGPDDYHHRLHLARLFVPHDFENQLVAGLDIILDYLNRGNGAPQLADIRRRAERWCEAHYSSTSDADHDADYAGYRRVRPSWPPQRVLDVHPHFFDVRRMSYMRLDSSPPALMRDGEDVDASDGGEDEEEVDEEGEDDYNEDGVSIAGSFRTPSSVDDTTSVSSLGSSSIEEFPPYEEPPEPLPHSDAPAVYIAKRCDLERETTDLRRIVDRLIANENEGFEDHQAAAAAGWPRHPGALPRRDEVCFRAVDLLDSPIMYSIPSVMTHLARMPSMVSYAARMRRKSMIGGGVTDEHHEAARRRACEVAQENKGVLVPSSQTGDGLPSLCHGSRFSSWKSMITASSSSRKRHREDEDEDEQGVDREEVFDYQEAREQEEALLPPLGKRRRGPKNLWGLIGR